MRLIDADALIEAINKSTCHFAEELWKRVVCDVISNQPTAYSIEKVVAELEEESDYEPIDYDYCDMSCSDEEHFIATNKAIKIVRKVGVE